MIWYEHNIYMLGNKKIMLLTLLQNQVVWGDLEFEIQAMFI